MIKKTEVKTFKVEYICDKCKKGIMVEICKHDRDPTIKITSNPAYFHKCFECNYQKCLNKHYPYIEYETK